MRNARHALPEIQNFPDSGGLLRLKKVFIKIELTIFEQNIVIHIEGAVRQIEASNIG